MKSGRKIKIHSCFFDNDFDFDDFITQLSRSVASYNKKKSTITAIEEETSLMENRTFLITLAILLGVFFVAVILLMIFKGVSNLKAITFILISLGPMVWVIRQIVIGLEDAEK